MLKAKTKQPKWSESFKKNTLYTYLKLQLGSWLKCKVLAL